MFNSCTDIVYLKAFFLDLFEPKCTDVITRNMSVSYYSLLRFNVLFSGMIPSEWLWENKNVIYFHGIRGKFSWWFEKKFLKCRKGKRWIVYTFHVHVNNYYLIYSLTRLTSDRDWVKLINRTRPTVQRSFLKAKKYLCKAMTSLFSER